MADKPKDKAHEKASDKLDKAFGYGRLRLGQTDTTDAALTVNNTGLFDHVPIKERPLKQRSWSEQHAPKEPPINETGSYAQGGKVAPNNRFGFATPGKYNKKGR